MHHLVFLLFIGYILHYGKFTLSLSTESKIHAVNDEFIFSSSFSSSFSPSSSSGSSFSPSLVQGYFLPLLQNDYHDEMTMGICITDQTASLSSSSSSSSSTSSTGAVHYTDASRSSHFYTPLPQSLVRTSPNCLFDQYDTSTKLWDKGSFCIPEILTGGGATGDVNNDGLPDIYIPRLDTYDSLYINLGNGTYEDYSHRSGIYRLTLSIRSNGVVFIDIDNDGDEDIYISTVGDTRMYLLMNNGLGYYLTEEAIERGVALTRSVHAQPGEGGLTSSFTIAVGDYNQDGWLDLFTTEWFPRQHLTPETGLGSPEDIQNLVTSKLLRNIGYGYFTDETLNANIRIKTRGLQSTTGTVDKNIKYNYIWWMGQVNQQRIKTHLQKFNITEPDLTIRIARLNRQAETLFTARYEQAEYITDALDSETKKRKDTTNPFRMPAHYLFPYQGVFTFGVNFVDLDHDNYPEIILSGDYGTSEIYWNQRNGTFTTGSFNLLWDLFDNSMGATIGDINQDTFPDVLFTSMTIKKPTKAVVDKFYPNAGIASTFEGNHLYLAEPKYNSVTSSRRHSYLWTDYTTDAGIKDTGWSWGGILFDYDNDGYLDLAVCNGMDDPETTDDDFAVNTPNMAFHNLGIHQQYKFRSMGSDLGLDDKRDGRTYFELDYDKDGDLDLVLINHADFPVLYRNDGGNQQNAWIRVQVKEPGCIQHMQRFTTKKVHKFVQKRKEMVDEITLKKYNYSSMTLNNRLSNENFVYKKGIWTNPPSGCRPRTSIGAIVEIQLNENENSRIIRKEISSAAAFMGQSELIAHIGLGSGYAWSSTPENPYGNTIYRLSITWPHYNASRDLFYVPVRTELTITAPREPDTIETLVCPSPDDPSSSYNVTGYIHGIIPCSNVQFRLSKILQNPIHGNVTFTYNLQGVHYIPHSPDFNGNDTFTYEIQDYQGMTSKAQVTLFINASTNSKDTLPSTVSLFKSDDSQRNGKQSSFLTTTPLVTYGPSTGLFHHLRGNVHTQTLNMVNGKNSIEISTDGKVTPSVVASSSTRLPNVPPNNLQNPSYGASFTPFIRLGLPIYSNVSPVGEEDIPNNYVSARLISNTLFGNAFRINEKYNLSTVPFTELYAYFGLFVAHDLVNEFPFEYLGKFSHNPKEDIFIPLNDSFWYSDDKNDESASLLRYLPYQRSSFIVAPSTSGASYGVRAKQQINQVSHYADMETLFGSNYVHYYDKNKEIVDQRLSMLQTTDLLSDTCGYLKLRSVSPQFSSVRPSAGLKNISYLKSAYFPSTTGKSRYGMVGPRTSSVAPLFITADTRANFHPGLLSMHTLFAREYNRILLLVQELRTNYNISLSLPNQSQQQAYDYPCINDFVIASTIVRAEYQAILWNEFLPLLVGKEFLETLILPYTGYNSSVDSSVTNEFATVASQAWIYSSLNDQIARYEEYPETLSLKETLQTLPPVTKMGPLTLRDSFFLSSNRYTKEGGIEAILRGALITPIQPIDLHFSEALRQYVPLLDSSQSYNTKGLDMVSILLQRSRDHGIPTYSMMNQLIYNRSHPHSISSTTVLSTLSPKLEQKLKEIYTSTNTTAVNGSTMIDLFLGCLLESNSRSFVSSSAAQQQNNNYLGYTCSVIYLEQMQRLRDGDRFWYENKEEEHLSLILGTYIPLLYGSKEMIGSDSTVLSLKKNITITNTILRLPTDDKVDHTNPYTLLKYLSLEDIILYNTDISPRFIDSILHRRRTTDGSSTPS